MSSKTKKLNTKDEQPKKVEPKKATTITSTVSATKNINKKETDNSVNKTKTKESSTEQQQQKNNNKQSASLIGSIIDIDLNLVESSNESLEFTFYAEDRDTTFRGSIHVTEAEEVDNPLDAIRKRLEESKSSTLSNVKVLSLDSVSKTIQVNAFNRSNITASSLKKPSTNSIPVWVVGRHQNDLVVIVNRTTIGLIDILSNFKLADNFYSLLNKPYRMIKATIQSQIDSNTVRLKLVETATQSFKPELNKVTIAMVKEIGLLSTKLVLPSNLPAEMKAIDVSKNFLTQPFSIFKVGDFIDVKLLNKSASSGIQVGCYDVTANHGPIAVSHHSHKPEVSRKRIEFSNDPTHTNFVGYAFITAIYTDMIRLQISTDVDATMMIDSIPELYRPYLQVGRHIAVLGQRKDNDSDLIVSLNQFNHKLSIGDTAILTVVGISKKALTVSIYGNKSRGLVYPDGLSDDESLAMKQLDQYKAGDILIGRVQKLATDKNPFLRFTAKESDLADVDIEKVTRPQWAVEDQPYDQQLHNNRVKFYQSIDLQSIKKSLQLISENSSSIGSHQSQQQQQKWVESADFDKMSVGVKRKFSEEKESQDKIEAEEDLIDEEDIVDSKKHKQDKKKTKQQIEQEIKQKEDLLSDHNIQPESSQDFERVLLGSPNSSFIWVKYMSFYLGLNEIQKAREIGERALKKVIPTEILELRNIWIALYNLENMYGTKDSLLKLFQKSILYQDPKIMYFSIINILENTKKFDLVEEYFKMFFRKFRHSAKVWCRYGEFLIRANKVDLFHQILKKATDSLPKRKQVEVISKFGQYEFKLGSAERGRTIFEGLVSSYPNRCDLWNVFIDMELKVMISSNNPKQVRQLFERSITLKTSDRNIKQFYKRYLQFEKEHGDSQSIEHVKSSALAYVEGTSSS